MNDREKEAVSRINALLRQNNPDDLGDLYPHDPEEYMLPAGYLEDLKLVAALAAPRLEE